MKTVFVAGLFHETHRFLDEKTRLRDFEILEGEPLLARRGDSSPLGGALELFAERECAVIPGSLHTAMPGGTVEDAAFEDCWDRIDRTWNPESDAIFLILHGAMTTETLDDAEGELLDRIRRLPGASRLPIFGVHDLHANFSPLMAARANALIAYRKNPHTDARDSSVRAAGMLVDCLESGQLPTMVHRRANLIWDPVFTGTADEPMAGLEAMARDMETNNGEVLAINVNAGFAYSDSGDTGVSFQVVTTDATCADALLGELVNTAREANEELRPLSLPFAQVLKEIRENQVEGPTLLIEPSDNIGGGAPGDGTGLFREVLEARLPRVGVCLNDPESVSRLEHALAGETWTLSLGGRGSRFDPGPVDLEVEFVSRSDGRFRLEDPNSHLASMSGDHFDMGPSAVVRHRDCTLLLTSRKTPPFDLGQWRSQGIRPEEFDFIIVKAAVAHRQAYDPIATRSFWVDTPGPCRARSKEL